MQYFNVDDLYTDHFGFRQPLLGRPKPLNYTGSFFEANERRKEGGSGGHKQKIGTSQRALMHSEPVVHGESMLALCYKILYIL